MRRALLMIACLVWPGVAQAELPPLVATPWRVGVEAMAGNAVLFANGRNDAHPIVGGTLRLAVGVFELGPYATWAPHELDDARELGGLAGVFLPFRRWLDLEAAATLGARRWSTDDTRYGPTGARFTDAAAGVRLGVSARAGRVAGVRVGALLTVSTDLAPRDLAWTWAADTAGTVQYSGTRRQGGTDVVLALTVGFDAAPSP